jgi:hypothetical protein
MLIPAGRNLTKCGRYIAPELKVLSISAWLILKREVVCALQPDARRRHSFAFLKISELSANGNIQFIYIFKSFAVLLIACLNYHESPTAVHPPGQGGRCEKVLELSERI